MANKRTGLVRFGDSIAGALMFAVALILLTGVGINFANIIGRYFFSTPIHWVEEVMTFMLIWLTFLSAGAIAWDDKHLSIDLFVPSLPPKARNVVIILGMLATIAISVLMLKQAWAMLSRFLSNDQTSLVAQIQMEIPHGAIPIGFALMILLLGLRVMIRTFSLAEANVDGVLDDLELSDLVSNEGQQASDADALKKGE